tara:strand:+ start:454 stop:669 length:216 start_codon:yes stop_codon:yes gene_type:complete
MPYHIKRTSVLTGVTVYFKEDNRWTDNYADRKSFANKSDADALVAPTTRRIGNRDVANANGAFKNSTVVEE